MNKREPGVWKCHGVIEKKGGVGYKPCGYIGTVSTFTESDNGLRCPNCGADDATFPHRLFRCKSCGKVGDQDSWFEESGLDEDPLDKRWPAEPKPCDSCGEINEERLRRELGKEGISYERRGEIWAEIDKGYKKPSQVEEFIVPLSPST